MNVRQMIIGAVTGGTIAFAGFAALGSTLPDEPSPAVAVEQQASAARTEDDPATAKDDPVDVGDYRDHKSPHKNHDHALVTDGRPKEDPKRDDRPQRRRQKRQDQHSGEQTTEQDQHSGEEPASDSGKVQAEDGSWVDPEFYDRTDYNRNGITDQTEPGWNNGAGEDAFKAEGTRKYQEWCQNNGGCE